MALRSFAVAALLLSALACQSVDGAGFDPDGGRGDGAGDTRIDPARNDARPPAVDASTGVDGAGGPADAGGGPADAPVPADAADVKPQPQPDAPAADTPVMPPMPDAPPACVPVAEICDGKDNDCDGQADEGFGIVTISTTYQALSTFHAGCNETTRFGLACNAAINRFCMARGCHNAGFGPLENSGGNATVACVTGATVRSVPLATLTTFHPGCLAEAAYSPPCNAAINRYCTSQGFVTGYGPAEFDGRISAVVCLAAQRATVVNTTYTALATHHPACTAAGERFGPACNAAMNRFCAGTGARTGLGPLENSADVAVVACLKP